MANQIVLSPLGEALAKLSGEPLVKQNVTGLIHDVQGQVKAALSGLSSDPDKAKEMLEQVASALSVVEDQATEPGLSAEASEGGSAGDGGTTAEIAAAAPSGSTVEKTDETPSVDASEADAEADDPAADSSSSSSKPSGTVTHTTEITPPSSSPSSSSSDETDKTGETTKAFKGFAKMQEELQEGFQKAMDEAVEKINKAAAYRPARPMGDGVPIGDLPASETVQKSDGVIEALGEGDLRKALDASGGEFHKLEDRVETETSKALAAAGITIRKFVVAPAPAEDK